MLPDFLSARSAPRAGHLRWPAATDDDRAGRRARL